MFQTNITRHPSRHTHNTNSGNPDVNISFEPAPNYVGIAAAAGNIWGGTINEIDQVDSVLEEAVSVVQNGKSAVVEVR